MMKRLTFIVSAVVALVFPLTAHSESPLAILRIGYLSLRSAPSHIDEAFQQVFVR
jgi:hypothetical protein